MSLSNHELSPVQQVEQPAPKKYNTNKVSAFQPFNIDDKQFISSPQLLKLLNNMNNIYTVTPISISNISQEQYMEHKEFVESCISSDDETDVAPTPSRNMMFNMKLKETTNYQIGLHFTFKGPYPDIFIIYYFNYSWLSNEEGKNEFTNWLKENILSDNKVVIISGEIKGWGKNKVVKAFQTLSEKLDCQDEDSIFKPNNVKLLSVNDSPSNISRKTVNIVKKKNPKVEIKESSDIEKLIANVLMNQSNMQKLMAQQVDVIAQLTKLKSDC